MGLLVCSLVVSLASLAAAGIPDLDNSTATTVATEQVSVYSLPNAGGQGFGGVFVFGGSTTDATVTVTLLDAAMTPVFNYPSEDLWIETDTGSFTFCAGGTVADFSTNQNGQTTWNDPMFAGASGAGLVIIVNGDALNQGPLDYLFNSPDINADLVVNLTDVVFFTQAFFGSYDYASDFYWDGIMNLSDIVLMAQGTGSSCP